MGKIKKATYKQIVEQIEKFETMMKASPMSPYFSMWESTLNKLKDNLSEAKIEDQEIRMKKLTDRVKKTCVHGVSEWFDWVYTLYKVEKTEEDKWKLESLCRQWTEQKEWFFDSQVEALEKIETLIGYKIYDRSRGMGDAEKDLENFKK